MTNHDAASKMVHRIIWWFPYSTLPSCLYSGDSWRCIVHLYSWVLIVQRTMGFRGSNRKFKRSDLQYIGRRECNALMLRGLYFTFLTVYFFFFKSLNRPACYECIMQVLFPVYFFSALAVQESLAWSRQASAVFFISLADSELLAIFNFPLDSQKLYSCSLSGISLICCDAYEMVSESLLPRVGQHFMHKRNTELSRWLHQGLMILTQCSVRICLFVCGFA